MVVSNPSEKYESQLGSLFPIYGKIKFMFQTTNQLLWYNHSCRSCRSCIVTFRGRFTEPNRTARFPPSCALIVLRFQMRMPNPGWISAPNSIHHTFCPCSLLHHHQQQQQQQEQQQQQQQQQHDDYHHHHHHHHSNETHPTVYWCSPVCVLLGVALIDILHPEKSRIPLVMTNSLRHWKWPI